MPAYGRHPPMLGRGRDEELLRQIAADVATIKADVGTVKNATTDHEARLRALERWRYALPTATLLGAGSTIAAVVALFHH